MSAKGPFDPKRLRRPLRWVLLVAAAAYVLSLGWRYSLVKLPEGTSPLFDVHAGDRAVVMVLAERDAVEAGHIVLWRDARGVLHLGRVVAIGGERVALDAERRQVRRLDDDQPYPLPAGLDVAAVVPNGMVLVLAENPLTRQEGGLVRRAAVEARVLGTMPF
ncbi:MAG: hypothetical protein IPH13_08375 [Planctomycetes bacterium]|nr:hypothetical protein [Planctomycetota bacterium]MCC7171032.1 hypothetical protein [Planctomycetota bacterium]